MFGFESRKSPDIMDRIETLRGEVSRLSHQVAKGARPYERRALSQANSAVEELAERAERLGSYAGEWLASGLSMARRGRREAGRELDLVAHRTQEVVSRHPAATAIAVVGIGLAVACIFSFAARSSRHRVSPRGQVRRPPAKGSR